MGPDNNSYPELLNFAAITEVFTPQVAEFAGDPNGSSRAIRLIIGPATTLERPGAFAVDAASNVYFINATSMRPADDSPLTVFSSSANSNVAPVRRFGSPSFTMPNRNQVGVF